MMIKLSDGCSVAADHIAEVSIKEHGGILVRMKDGIAHHLGADYGKSDWATQDRLVNLINAACGKEPT